MERGHPCPQACGARSLGSRSAFSRAGMPALHHGFSPLLFARFLLHFSHRMNPALGVSNVFKQ
jgi:hypothetical protein